MSIKDLYLESFEAGEIKKLEIFEGFAENWIHTYVMKTKVEEIHFFVFFSGTGYDINGVPGSPIRILKAINKFTDLIVEKGKKIVLHLNEFETDKSSQQRFQMLVENCKVFKMQNPNLNDFLTVRFFNKNVDELFFELVPTIKFYPSLVLLDQDGIRFVNKKYISVLEKMKETDLICFVSSSSLSRFAKTQEFQNILNIIPDETEYENFSNFHLLVSLLIKKSSNRFSELKISHFIFKSNSNLYGIIFRSHHFRAIDKFLGIAWKSSSQYGEADFDIDNDSNQGQNAQFDSKKFTKIEQFQIVLESKILKGELRDNRDVLVFTYENGHLPKHASDLIKNLHGVYLRYNKKTPASITNTH
jgi:three-Cys-motif partner protein